MVTIARITPTTKAVTSVIDKVRPLSPLDQAAKVMLADAITYSKNLDNSILNFLNITNKKDQHGHAVVAFFTELNELRKHNPRDFCYELIETIEDKVCRTPYLKRRGNVFMGRLKKKYPKYMYDRFTLANYGCVSSRGIKKQSMWKKLLITIMHKLR